MITWSSATSMALWIASTPRLSWLDPRLPRRQRYFIRGNSSSNDNNDDVDDDEDTVAADFCSVEGDDDNNENNDLMKMALKGVNLAISVW